MGDTVLDVRGLACPLPVLRAKRAMKDVELQGVLHVLATDPGALKDIPAFCAQVGYELVTVTAKDDGVFVFEIKRTV